MYSKLLLGLVAFGGGLAGLLISTSYLVVLSIVTLSPASAFNQQHCLVTNVSSIYKMDVAVDVYNLTGTCASVVTYLFHIGLELADDGERQGVVFSQVEEIRCTANRSLDEGNHTCFVLQDVFASWASELSCADPHPPCVSALKPEFIGDLASRLAVSMVGLLLAVPLFYMAVFIWGGWRGDNERAQSLVPLFEVT